MKITLLPRWFAFLVAGLTALVLAPRAQPAAGDLDPSFGSNGVVRIGMGGGDDAARALALQTDGKVVVAGVAGFPEPRIALLRYDTNHHLDHTFGDAGKVITQSGALSNSQPYAVRIQNDGKIVAAGTAFTGGNDFVVVRYETNGTLDTSFNGTGFHIVDLGGYDVAEALVLQPDGKIVVAGQTPNAPLSTAVLRFNSNGTLDSTWNGTGKFTTSAITEVKALLYLDGGKVLVAGKVAGHIGLLRLNSNGTVDNTFGAAGRTNAVVGGFSSATAMTILFGNNTFQNPDRILVAGGAHVSGQDQFALARFNLDGTRDTTFATGGALATPFAGASATPRAIAVTGALNSRRIVVAGTAFDTRYKFALARYTVGGTLDNTFDGDGLLLSAVTSKSDEAYAMLVTGGRFLVAGRSEVEVFYNDIVLARYNSDGSLDATYDDDGVKVEDIEDQNSTLTDITVQPDGKAVLVGAAAVGSRFRFGVVRLQENGELDPSFGAGGRIKAQVGTNTSRADAVALQPDGKVVVAGAADGGAGVVRYLTNGFPDPAFDLDGQFNATNGTLSSIALQPDGRIVVGGQVGAGSSRDFLIGRLTTNGAPDSTFDMDGWTTTSVANGEDGVMDIKIQGDGKILAAGIATVNGQYDFALVRYLTNGAVDNHFGSFGRVATDLQGGADAGLGVAFQTNGRIVFAGYSVHPTTGNIDVGLAQYLTNGLPDSAFDGDGKLTTAVGLADDYGTDVIVRPDGKLLVAGIARIGGEAMVLVLRYLPNGSLDSNFGNGGRVVVNLGERGPQVVRMSIDGRGRILLGTTAQGKFAAVRLLGDPELRITSIVRLPNGRIRLEGTGVPISSHTIYASSTVTGTFNGIGTVTADRSGAWQFEDAAATGMTQRFYRFGAP
jgi:uncharacterized delta-60 repeat protein